MKKYYDIVFLIEGAIGNTIEMLYALEYCLDNNLKAGIVVDKVGSSFKAYLEKCYGDGVILPNDENISCTNIVHTWIYEDQIKIKYENYHYILPDEKSTQYLSETEMYLSLVKSLYPSSHRATTLKKLIADDTVRVINLHLENKYVLYPGSASTSSVKRWPHFSKLIERIGESNTIVVGGADDLNSETSYIYRRMITKLFPIKVTNHRPFWRLCRNMYLLKPYAHNTSLSALRNSYFNTFTWGELVAIFKRCNGFIGNDGGLMHLAAAAGAKGVVIFGPSSVNKNRPYNPTMKVINRTYACQPCQFNVAGISMAKKYISCPFQVRCLADITADNVLETLSSNSKDPAFD